MCLKSTMMMIKEMTTIISSCRANVLMAASRVQQQSTSYHIDLIGPTQERGLHKGFNIQNGNLMNKRLCLKAMGLNRIHAWLGLRLFGELVSRMRIRGTEHVNIQSTAPGKLSKSFPDCGENGSQPKQRHKERKPSLPLLCSFHFGLPAA